MPLVPPVTIATRVIDRPCSSSAAGLRYELGKACLGEKRKCDPARRQRALWAIREVDNRRLEAELGTDIDRLAILHRIGQRNEAVPLLRIADPRSDIEIAGDAVGTTHSHHLVAQPLTGARRLAGRIGFLQLYSRGEAAGLLTHAGGRFEMRK